MKGTFNGWIPDRAFGFIAPDDESGDVFLHKSEIADEKALKRGSRLSFEITHTERGLNAKDVEPLETQSIDVRGRGRLKFWNDRGYGFVVPEEGGDDVYVNAIILPRDCEGYLCQGDIVEYEATQLDRGLEAVKVSVVGWEAPSDHLASFADMGPPGWLDDLSGKAEDEQWDYKRTTGPEPIPILRSFVRYTFRRLEETGGIRVSDEGSWAAFNTGLVTPNQEEIFALLEKNPLPDRQPWHFEGFHKASDWVFIDNFGASPPPLAQYFDDPSVLMYDRRCELYINIDHVMEHILRFPEELRDNPYVARQLLVSAEATTKKRVYRNYKTAIPQYYRESGGEGSVQLLMPICLQDPSRADLALVVDKNETGDAYRGSTVLTLDMAYNNARLLARPDTEWLQP